MIDLLCVLCYYTRDVPEPAVTVIGGFATCDTHAEYFLVADLSRLISLVNKNEVRL